MIKSHFVTLIYQGFSLITLMIFFAIKSPVVGQKSGWNLQAPFIKAIIIFRSTTLTHHQKSIVPDIPYIGPFYGMAYYIKKNLSWYFSGSHADQVVRFYLTVN
jgi:hypothetical protein